MKTTHEIQLKIIELEIESQALKSAMDNYRDCADELKDTDRKACMLDLYEAKKKLYDISRSRISVLRWVIEQ